VKKRTAKQIIIGLTGGPGVGKTEAAMIMARRGVQIISADKIGHQILKTNAKVRRGIKAILGESAFDSNGIPNRKMIGESVFANPELLAEFNALVHPALLRILKSELNKNVKAGNKIIAVDAALIYEWGIADWFDILVVVDASREIRLKRLIKSGLTRSQAIKRIGAQIPQKDKKALADFVITNNGDFSLLAAKTTGFVKLLNKVL
jgi:dephospho-CoA kinase